MTCHFPSDFLIINNFLKRCCGYSRRVIVIAFLLLYFSFCYAQPAKIDSSRVRKFRIDPQTAKGAPASALFKQVKYIPLETTKESLFGEVAKLKVFADRLVIFDIDTWSVLIFSSDGKFINKITDKTIRSLGPGALNPNGSGNAFMTFFITKTDQESFIDIPGKNVVFRFNQDGVFKTKINGYINESYSLTDKTSVVSGFELDKERWYTFGIVNDRDTAKYFPFQLKRYEENDYIITGEFLNYEKGGERMLFHDYYSYNLFELSDAGVRFKYQIILPDDISIPADFLTNPAYRLKQDQYVSDNRKKVYGLSGCYEIDDYLYFTLSSRIQQQSVKESLAYNLKTGELISLQDIMPDPMSYFLPVNDSAFGHQFLMDGFSFYDPYKNQLYSSIPSATMVMLGKKNAANAKLYPPKLADYFKKSDNNNNPVIVVLEPKDGK